MAKKPKIVNIRITSAADDRKVAGSLNGRKFCVPNDGNFHPIREDLLPALDDSEVQYEISQPEPAKAPAGGAGGLGGSTAPPSPLDHDGDGKKGGSKKGAQSTRRKGAAKKALLKAVKAITG